MESSRRLEAFGRLFADGLRATIWWPFFVPRSLVRGGRKRGQVERCRRVWGGRATLKIAAPS